MRSVFEERVGDARKTERHFSTGTGKIVSRRFGAVARLLWPVKTAAVLAAIAQTNERTAARWLAGEFEPPVCVVLATMDEIFKRQE